MTPEQNNAIVQAELDAHFGPKPATPPREKVPEEKINHFIHMARPPAPKPVDSDYERQIRKARRARAEGVELEIEPSSWQKMRENRSRAGRIGGAINPPACCACWKYALEAIIKVLLLYFLVHDNCLLFML